MTNRGIPVPENIDVLMRAQTYRPLRRVLDVVLNSEANTLNLPPILEDKPRYWRVKILNSKCLR